MIAYLFLAVGTTGTAAALYYAAPAGRGVHRYVVPRSKLRAMAARAEADANELAGLFVGVCNERDAIAAERDGARALLGKAELLVADLERQLKAFDDLCTENTQLRADLGNARAMRQQLPGPSPADDASALPDEVQDFVNETAIAWRASA